MTGLFLEGLNYLRREICVSKSIGLASLIVGRKFTVFALFYFAFEGNFQVQAPRGAYIWRGDLTEGFLRYEFEGLIHGAAYFRNFTVFAELNNPKRALSMTNLTSMEVSVF